MPNTTRRVRLSGHVHCCTLTSRLAIQFRIDLPVGCDLVAADVTPSELCAVKFLDFAGRDHFLGTDLFFEHGVLPPFFSTPVWL